MKMKATIKKQVIEKLTQYEKFNMKYAAMDWDYKWFCFEKKPRCVDDTWDVKEGNYIRIHTLPTEGFDWRDSLIQK
jgi:hypothetical protein